SSRAGEAKRGGVATSRPKVMVQYSTAWCRLTSALPCPLLHMRTKPRAQISQRQFERQWGRVGATLQRHGHDVVTPRRIPYRVSHYLGICRPAAPDRFVFHSILHVA